MAHCGSHLIIFISNKSHLFITPRKRVSCLFQLGCQSPHSVAPWLFKVAYRLSLAFFGHCSVLTQSSLLSRQPQEPSYLSGLKPGGPTWLFMAFIGVLWPLLMQSSLPCLTTARTILFKWTQYWWSSLDFLWQLLSQSRLPAWLTWEPSYLSGLSPSGSPWLSLSFPLEFPLWTLICPILRTGFAYLILYIDLHTARFFHYFCYSILFIVFLILVYIFQVVRSPKEQLHCKSSINIIQLETCAYFSCSISFLKPILIIVRRGYLEAISPTRMKQARHVVIHIFKMITLRLHIGLNHCKIIRFIFKALSTVLSYSQD